MNRLRFASLILLLFLCALSSSAQTTTPSADGWVVLPVTEYAALKRAASPAEPEPAMAHTTLRRYRRLSAKDTLGRRTPRPTHEAADCAAACGRGNNSAPASNRRA